MATALIATVIPVDVVPVEQQRRAHLLPLLPVLRNKLPHLANLRQSVRQTAALASAGLGLASLLSRQLLPSSSAQTMAVSAAASY